MNGKTKLKKLDIDERNRLIVCFLYRINALKSC